MKYPIRYRSRPEGIQAVLIDFPKYVATGATREDAKFAAVDMLLSALQLLLDSGDALPEPSPQKKTWDVLELSLNVQLKLLMHKRMLELGWNRTVLATQMDIERKRQRTYINRLFNLRYYSRLDQLIAVFYALGVTVRVHIIDASE